MTEFSILLVFRQNGTFHKRFTYDYDMPLEIIGDYENKSGTE